MKMPVEDSFYLFDLKIEVIESEKAFVCSHKSGESFLVQGENLVFLEPFSFSLYALSSILPLLPAKQRQTDENDWMSTDDLIACPDPNCGARFKISRTEKRKFFHHETTATKLIKN